MEKIRGEERKREKRRGAGLVVQYYWENGHERLLLRSFYSFWATSPSKLGSSKDLSKLLKKDFPKNKMVCVKSTFVWVGWPDLSNGVWKVYFCVGRSAPPVNVVSIILLSLMISLNGPPVEKNENIEISIGSSDRGLSDALVSDGSWETLYIDLFSVFAHLVIKYSPLLMQTPPGFSLLPQRTFPLSTLWWLGNGCATGSCPPPFNPGLHYLIVCQLS